MGGGGENLCPYSKVLSKKGAPGGGEIPKKGKKKHILGVSREKKIIGTYEEKREEGRTFERSYYFAAGGKVRVRGERETTSPRLSFKGGEGKKEGDMMSAEGFFLLPSLSRAKGNKKRRIVGVGWQEGREKDSPPPL